MCRSKRLGSDTHPEGWATKWTVYIVSLIGVGFSFIVYGLLSWHKFTTTVDFCSRLYCDFIDYYYPMGERVIGDGIPVVGFLYSPFIAILMAVFPPLGLDISLVLWGLLQAAAIVLYVVLLNMLVPSKPTIKLLLVALTLLSYPLWLNFLTGNTSAFIAVALLGSLLAVNRSRYTIAAILLAFSVSFKFYTIIFVIPFFFRRHARFAVLSVLISIVLLFVIPSLILGLARTFEYYGALLGSFQESGWVATNPHSQFLPHLAFRLMGFAADETAAAGWILYGLSYSIAAVNLILACLVQRARVHHVNTWCFLILFLTTPFILKTSWPIDFAYLPFAQAFMIWHAWSKGQTDLRENGDRRKRSLTLLFLVLTSILLSNIVLFNLIADFSFYGYGGFLLAASAMLLAAVYVELLPQLRHPPRRSEEAARR